MPNSPLARYRPGTPVDLMSASAVIAIPGIVIDPVRRTSPAFTNAFVDADRNSMSNAFRPCRNEPSSDLSAMTMSPDRIV